jgi:hypothetical protein
MEERWVRTPCVPEWTLLSAHPWYARSAYPTNVRTLTRVTEIEDIDDYRWLITPEAALWIERAMAAGAKSTLQLVATLRHELSASRAHLVVEQAELRARGARKFAAAARMFFTTRSLEQATDEGLAAYKSSRFPQGAAVADLCCGVGGDLLALARRAPTTGVDRDPVLGLLAEANCRVVMDGSHCWASQQWHTGHG